MISSLLEVQNNNFIVLLKINKEIVKVLKNINVGTYILLENINIIHIENQVVNCHV